jgi:hypothetical protein
MPALVKRRVGSFLTTIGADGTIWCFFEAKKARNSFLISALVIIKGYKFKYANFIR